MNALNIAEYSQTLGIQARAASSLMARASAASRSACLRRLAALLRENQPALRRRQRAGPGAAPRPPACPPRWSTACA